MTAVFCSECGTVIAEVGRLLDDHTHSEIERRVEPVMLWLLQILANFSGDTVRRIVPAVQRLRDHFVLDGPRTGAIKNYDLYRTTDQSVDSGGLGDNRHQQADDLLDGHHRIEVATEKKRRLRTRRGGPAQIVLFRDPAVVSEQAHEGRASAHEDPRYCIDRPPITPWKMHKTVPTRKYLSEEPRCSVAWRAGSGVASVEDFAHQEVVVRHRQSEPCLGEGSDLAPRVAVARGGRRPAVGSKHDGTWDLGTYHHRYGASLLRKAMLVRLGLEGLFVGRRQRRRS